MRWIRRPAKEYSLWKLGLLLAGTAMVAVAAFVLTDLLTASMRTSAMLSVVAGSLSLSALAAVLYVPNDSQLLTAFVNAEVEYKIADSRLANQKANDGLQTRVNHLKDLTLERSEYLSKLHAAINSGMRQRRALLQQNWRAMRADEWEEFLVRVFEALGAKAKRIGRAGDQGVDLIVEIGTRRIAVQAKGYLNSVSNTAIQEAFTGKVFHDCTDCAVITNSRFTPAAQNVAAKTGCILIGEDEIADLVVGKVSLLDFTTSNESRYARR
jgi:restriction endonuclease Mrr